MSAARQDWLFKRIDVGEVWGVGRRIGARLHEMGIDTVQALMAADPRNMRAQFGVVMERTCAELRGNSCLMLEELAPARKEIVSSRSFGQMISTLDDLSEAVSIYVSRASEKLRGQGSVCGAIHVFVHTNRFREQDPQYCNGVTIPFPDPTDDLRTLAGAAICGLHKIYRTGFQYKKAGVMLMDISPNTFHQGTLFNQARPREATVKVMAALDGLNKRFGRDALHIASAGLGHRWAMRAENRTPRYTTHWNELPTAHAN